MKSRSAEAKKQLAELSLAKRQHIIRTSMSGGTITDKFQLFNLAKRIKFEIQVSQSLCSYKTTLIKFSAINPNIKTSLPFVGGVLPLMIAII